MTVVGIARLARYSAEALLGLYFGHQVIEISKSKGVEVAIIGLVLVSLGGSIVTSYKWIKRSKARTRPKS